MTLKSGDLLVLNGYFAHVDLGKVIFIVFDLFVKTLPLSREAEGFFVGRETAFVNGL